MLAASDTLITEYNLTQHCTFFFFEIQLAYIEDDSQPMYDDTTKQRNRQGGRNRQRWNRQNNHANMPLRCARIIT